MSMIPNVFPAVLVFGTMGWLGIMVDVGAMMTASVALGIAVDDTLHFLTWFRRSRAAGRSQHASIIDAYDRCAIAMTQTTITAGAGLLVYVLSDFQPVSQFGLLMAILLAAALVGDLVLLPALLATKAGEGFAVRPKQSE
jgi:predicted RND superfamily exporter protein